MATRREKTYLVGGLEHVLFSIMYGIILPIDFHIFQDGFLTTNQTMWGHQTLCLLIYNPI